MHYLAATASVHATAAICDYLDDRAAADDTVTVVAVAPPDDATARRDAQEALNVAPVRLAAVETVETDLREAEGEPADVLLEAARAIDADEILLTPHDADPGGSTALGSTARALLEASTLPVVVVPAPDL